MNAFKVSINGKHQAIAGIREKGVVSIGIHERDHADDFEREISIGGLEENKDGERRQLVWFESALKLGDEIVIRIVDVADCDAPAKVKKLNPEDDLKLKRAYFNRLREELERAEGTGGHPQKG